MVVWIVEKVDGRQATWQNINHANTNQFAIQPILLMKRPTAHGWAYICLPLLKIYNFIIINPATRIRNKKQVTYQWRFHKKPCELFQCTVIRFIMVNCHLVLDIKAVSFFQCDLKFR